MKLSGSYYATSFPDVWSDAFCEYVDDMIQEGTPVTVCTDLVDAAEIFNIDKNEIQQISREDEEEE